MEQNYKNRYDTHLLQGQMHMQLKCEIKQDFAD